MVNFKEPNFFFFPCECLQMKGLVRAYFVEAKWFNTKYVPTFEEYLDVSIMSSGYPMLAVQSLIGIGEVGTKERVP